MDAFYEFGISKDLIKTQVNEIVWKTKNKKIECDISHVPLAVVNRVKNVTLLNTKIDGIKYILKSFLDSIFVH